MIRKIYVIYNSGKTQEEVDGISVSKFVEQANESYYVKDFINKVIKDGWDPSKAIVKVVEEKEVQSINYVEFTRKEVETIAKIGFRNVEDALGIITLNTTKAKLKVSKYYGGVYCLTYYDKESDMLDSILFNNFAELIEELQFFKSDAEDVEEDYGTEYSVSDMVNDVSKFKMLSDEVPDVMES